MQIEIRKNEAKKVLNDLRHLSKYCIYMKFEKVKSDHGRNTYNIDFNVIDLLIKDNVIKQVKNYMDFLRNRDIIEFEK